MTHQRQLGKYGCFPICGMQAIIVFYPQHEALQDLAAELQLYGKEIVDRPERYNDTHTRNCIFIAQKNLRMVWTYFSIFLLAIGSVKRSGIISRNIIQSQKKVPCANQNFTSKNIEGIGREFLWVFPQWFYIVLLNFPCKSFSICVKTRNRTHDLSIQIHLFTKP